VLIKSKLIAAYARQQKDDLTVVAKEMLKSEILENASTDRKCKYRAGHSVPIKNTSIENASTSLHRWTTPVWKTKVRICRAGLRKYGKHK